MIASLLTLLAAVGPMPSGSPTSWITPDDYPPAAIIKGEQGHVTVAVTVDPDGHPKDCKISQSSGSVDLDALSCSLIQQRASFHPAHDETGKATEGIYRNTVSWVLPMDRLSDQGGVFHYTMNEAGKIIDCKSEKLGDFSNDITCDTFGVEAVLQSGLNEPLGNFSRIDFSLLLQVSKNPLQSSMADSPTRHIMAGANMEVDRHGAIASCRSFANFVFRGRTLDLCSIAKKGDALFAPDASAPVVRPARVTMEISGIRR